MATSPNYGWLEPDNTDLVKNGALAIRTLGNAIDTTMATMVPKSIVDAKGDLIAGTAADTAARLAVGNNGETLVADSSTATGLRYNPQNALVNPVINGGMDIWQRGTSIAIGSNLAFWTADRWKSYNAGPAITVSRQTTSDTTNLPNIQYCSRVQRNSGQTSTSLYYLANSFETVNSLPYAGKSVTFSFYARAGANYSTTSNALTANLYSGTGTDQNFIDVAYTGQATVAGGTATLTTTWQRFTFTGTVAATATELAVVFQTTGTGTAGANDYFEVTGVQIDLGTYTASSAPTFRRSGGTIQGELAACQRYYFRNTVDQVYGVTATGFATSSTNVLVFLQMPVQMRVTPTAVEYANLRLLDSGFAGSLTNLTISANECSKNVALLTATGTGYTAHRGAYLSGNNNAAGYVAVTAEL